MTSRSGFRFFAPRAVDVLALGSLASRCLAVTLEGASAGSTYSGGIVLDRPALEDRLGIRKAWSSRDLDLLGPVGSGDLSYLSGARSDLPASGADLDDKPRGREFLRRASLEVPQALVVEPPDLRYAPLAEELGPRIVVQTPGGSGGNGTWIADRDEDLSAARRSSIGDAGFLVSTWIEGPLVNLHLYVGESECVISALSFQLCGAHGLAPNPAAYCGADFAAASTLPADETEAIRDGAAELGSCLWEEGWRGLIGVDAILSPRGAVFLEMNPRYQASTWLLSELEAEAGLVPLGEIHALNLLASKTSDRSNRPKRPEVTRRGNLNGSTFTVRSQRGRATQQDEIEMLVESPLAGWSAGGLPGPEVRRIETGAAIYRLTSREPALSPGGSVRPEILEALKSDELSGLTGTFRVP